MVSEGPGVEVFKDLRLTRRLTMEARRGLRAGLGGQVFCLKCWLRRAVGSMVVATLSKEPMICFDLISFMGYRRLS